MTAKSQSARTPCETEVSRMLSGAEKLLRDGYTLAELPDGTWRAYKPGRPEAYVVDVCDPRTPCNCTAGLHGRSCKHLNGVLLLLALQGRMGGGAGA